MMINCIMSTSKTLTDLCFTKQRIKTKNTFVRVVYIVLVVKMCWQNKEVCLSVNGAQYAKLEKETIEFKKKFNQITVSFKIYVDFECNLKKFMESSTQKNIKITFLVVLLTKLFILMINLLSE